MKRIILLVFLATLAPVLLSCSQQEEQKRFGLSICENVQEGDMLLAHPEHYYHSPKAIVVKKPTNCAQMLEDFMVLQHVWSRRIQPIAYPEELSTFSAGIVEKSSPLYGEILKGYDVCKVAQNPIRLVPCEFELIPTKE